MSGFFITGSDTEIGKTFVSSLLIQLLVEEGLDVIGMKPIASGANIIDGIFKNEDALSLIKASNVSADYQNINPYVFEPAIAPHLAAEESNVEIDLDVIKTNFELLQKKTDVVVVEGVGGWYAPLSLNTTVADLAEAVQLPIIIVVGLRLGCMNHALLTVQAIRQSGLPIAGWVANYVDNNFSYAEKNISTLKHYLNDVPFLGSVTHQINHDSSCSLHDLKKNILKSMLSDQK